MHRLQRTLAIIAIATMALVACSNGDSDTDSASTTGPDTTADDSESADDGPTTTTTAPTTTAADDGATSPEPGAGTAGCESGDPGIPDGASSREVVDVDGDGEPDTGWVQGADGTTLVGISTAAGGGSRIEYESASPIPRDVLVVDSDDTPPVEIIISDGRGASLYAF